VLQEYDIVIAESYIGNRIAYGMDDGIPKESMMELNKGLRDADISIVLDGKAFVEKSIRYFWQDGDKMNRIRKILLELAKEYDWRIINANQSAKKVHQNIWDEIFMQIAHLDRV